MGLSKHETGVSPALLICIFMLTLPNHTSPEMMVCKYGDRGSLTAICINATNNFFKDTTYRFDHLDETVKCLNCTLTRLARSTFDIGGNRIQNLYLGNSEIQVVEENAFTGLVFLEKLVLSDNKIFRLEVGAFYGARKIKVLNLENALTAPLPNFAFQGLWELRELTLSRNSLTIIEKKTFYGLNSLQFLNLSYNKIKHINESISFLSNLRLLDLHNNEIFEIGPMDFHKSQNILEIDLSNNLIFSLGSNPSQLNRLRKINLSNNHFSNEVVKIEHFNDMRSLEILDLSLNYFRTIPPKLFQGLYALRELILCNNTITEFKSGAFSGLPSLRLLNLSHNVIEKVDITGRLSLRQLHIIDFSHNKISDFDLIKLLQRLPRISTIDLSDNLLNCKKRRRIEEYLKNENIELKAELQQCPKLEKDDIKQLYLEANNEIDSLESTSPLITALKIIFIVLSIVLIGLLFYSHFFILTRRGY